MYGKVLLKERLCHKEPARSKQNRMAELVLHGIRLLAKQFLGTFHDNEVDQSALETKIETFQSDFYFSSQISLTGDRVSLRCKVLSEVL